VNDGPGPLSLAAAEDVAHGVGARFVAAHLQSLVDVETDTEEQPWIVPLVRAVRQSFLAREDETAGCYSLGASPEGLVRKSPWNYCHCHSENVHWV